MNTLPVYLLIVAALTVVSTGCAEPETPAATLAPDPPSASTVFSPLSDDAPLPADQVFVPDAHVEDGALLFRIQLLPGYYLYKDKIQVRSLDDTVSLDSHHFIEEWGRSEFVVDEWFGEQAVFFNEAHGTANLRVPSPGIGKLDIELVYQGCKKDGLCYLPQTKVLSVDLPTQLESAAEQTE